MKLQQVNGFTLLELLVVLIITGVLLSITVPNYFEYISEKRVLRGETLLLEIMQLQEQFHSQNQTYTLDLTELQYGAADHPSSDYYQLSANTCSQAITKCVTLVATPVNDDDPTLELSSLTDEINRSDEN